MITTLEHPLPAILPRAAWKAVPVLRLLAPAVGMALYLALLIQSSAAATRPLLAAQFGPLPSHNGALRGQVVEHPSRFVIDNEQRWVVRLESRDGLPLQHARLGVTVYMPETGQRGPSPLARPTGVHGEYELLGVRFDRAGWWNVALVVRSEAVEDSLAFNVSVR